MYILFINPTKSPEELAPVFPAHSEFLNSYVKTGKFILTGGLTARPAGLVLANVNSEEELKAMLAEDPFVAVAGGRCFFRYEDLIKLVELVEKLR